jgi:FtsZ-binding cell division protein ZapB
VVSLDELNLEIEELRAENARLAAEIHALRTDPRAVERIAQKIRKTRDETWVATQKLADVEVPVNRTDSMAFLGGAQNTNEECYLFQKAARLLGMPFVERASPEMRAHLDAVVRPRRDLHRPLCPMSRDRR